MIYPRTRIEGGSSELMRVTGFRTNRSKKLQSISAMDKSRLTIPSDIDKRETLNLMIDRDKLQQRGKKLKVKQEIIEANDNALIQLKMKSTFLNNK